MAEVNKGWFSLERSLWDHWLAPKKPYSKFEAWIDLIRGANHAPAKIMLKGQLISLDRGDQARSQVTLANNWGWSRDKVRRFCKLLEDEGKIRQQNNNVTSILTICNYSEKQNNKAADKTASETAEKHLKDSRRYINNNVNNDNNEKKGAESLKFNEDDLKCANYMLEKLLALDPKFKIPNLDKWADEVRLIREADKRDHKEICTIFKFANDSDFWKGNILSPKSLRKNFSKLKIQKNEANKNTEGPRKVFLPKTDFSLLEWVATNKNKYKFPEALQGEDMKTYRGRIQNILNISNEGIN